MRAAGGHGQFPYYCCSKTNGLESAPGLKSDDEATAGKAKAQAAELRRWPSSTNCSGGYQVLSISYQDYHMLMLI